ncbi:MAG: type II toxin-antitoxin system ParD family antitoxin [Magnetococcales bacterium]|nr:type II toxin-antitoxin system ParD family antitoxin [Magnetococcales bacterium]
MEVTLTPSQESFIKQRIHEGAFTSPSEIISEGLHLLMEREQEKAKELAWLRREIQIGLDQIERGETATLEEVIAGMDEMIAKAEPG